MRKRFTIELSLGVIPIEEVTINPKSRDALPKILKGIQGIYKNAELRNEIFRFLEKHINTGSSKSGRTGMQLWEIFVLSMIRSGVNISYDRLLDLSNNHKTMCGIMGVEPSDFTVGKEYDYQNLWDNSQLITDDMLHKINDIVVKYGHGVSSYRYSYFLSHCFTYCHETI